MLGYFIKHKSLISEECKYKFHHNPPLSQNNNNISDLPILLLMIFLAFLTNSSEEFSDSASSMDSFKDISLGSEMWKKV